MKICNTGNTQHPLRLITLIKCLLFIIVLLDCQKNNDTGTLQLLSDDESFIKAVDISSYPAINQSKPVFYDKNGQPNDFLKILKECGVNTIRLRLWVNPPDEHSGFDEVKLFSQKLKQEGFRTWLTVHYSDTWADPAHQQCPKQWQGLSYTALKDSVYSYTKHIVSELQPYYIQIGNEINSGLLHPYGHLPAQLQQFKELLNTATAATRLAHPNTKIILHFAGIENAHWFYEQVNSINYDIIGLSYYPIWHGKNLHRLKTQMESLSQTFEKKILLAETAYPFTLGWNDWTNNIAGLDEHLILPDYPASVEGQKSFVRQIKNISREVKNGIGFCYWGGELIAWKGNQATDGSTWENQALFDFQHKALLALDEFK